ERSTPLWPPALIGLRRKSAGLRIRCDRRQTTRTDPHALWSIEIARRGNLSTVIDATSLRDVWPNTAGILVDRVVEIDHRAVAVQKYRRVRETDDVPEGVDGMRARPVRAVIRGIRQRAQILH